MEPVAADSRVGDRTSMAFSGTLVAAGHGVGVVTAIGGEAEIGRIQTMLADVEQFETPLTREMNQFGKQLSMIILGMAAVRSSSEGDPRVRTQRTDLRGHRVRRGCHPRGLPRWSPSLVLGVPDGQRNAIAATCLR